MKKNPLFIFISLAMFASSAMAVTASDVSPSVIKAITSNFSSIPGHPPGSVPDEISTTPIAGLFQVVYGSSVSYIDATGQYVVDGSVINVKTGVNLNDAKTTQITLKQISQLDLKGAVKRINGKGTRVIYTFEDANCGYCKKLIPELANVQNVTIYTFPVGFLGEGSLDKAKRVLCAPTPSAREAIWLAYMGDKAVENGDSTCEAGVVQLAKNTRYAQVLGVRGTPTMIFKDGSRLPGYGLTAAIEKHLSEIK